MSLDPSFQKEFVNLTCQFLETWFHQILYQRNIYPKTIFELQKQFEIPVYIAIHPKVQKYLSNFVQSCYSLIEKDKIKYICLTILQQEIPIEKFVFELKSSSLNNEFSIADLRYYLRSCLIKITQLHPSHYNIHNNEEDRTFSLSIENNDSGYPEIQQHDWIPSQQSTNWHHILPLKSVPTFNTFVMESSRKGKERI